MQALLLHSKCVLAIIVVASCRGEAAVLRRSQVDSAGIVIVTNAVPAVSSEDGWAVLDALVEIGTSTDDPLLQFDQIRGATRLSNGEIVVATASPPLIRWYGADGVYIRGAGTFGEGPGEFVGRPGIYALWKDGTDTIGVWERPRQLVHLFDGGRYVRAVAVRGPGVTFPTVFARLSDGRFLAYTTSDPAPRDSGNVAFGTLSFRLIGEDGSSAEFVEGVSSSGEVLSTVDGLRVWRSHPFASASSFVVINDEIYFGFPSQYEIGVTILPESSSAQSASARPTERSLMTSLMRTRRSGSPTHQRASSRNGDEFSTKSSALKVSRLSGHFAMTIPGISGCRGIQFLGETALHGQYSIETVPGSPT
jgi:hypothetical protein